MSAPVVTGWGSFNPLGASAETSFAALVRGESRRGPVSFFSTEGCHCREASVAPMPEEPEDGRRPSRAARLAMPALKEALAHAGLLDRNGHCRIPRAPLSVSTTGGAMAHGEAFLAGALAGRRRGQFRRVAQYQPHRQVRDMQRAFGLEGTACVVANACASGANAIGHAADLVRAGRAELVLAGGYEALTDLIFTGFDCLQALSPTCCRPFDRARDGLMLGEGAAFVVIESEAHARARGAEIRGRILGYGQSTDLHHLTQPSPDGRALTRAMEAALKREDVDASRVGYLNAHGTGTPMNDGAEAAAYAGVQGGAWFQGVRLSSSKAAIGHTLGAAGAIEAVFTLQALAGGVPPPQIHVREALPEVAGQLAQLGESWPRDRPLAMSVNLGFGGSNAALLLGPA